MTIRIEMRIRCFHRWMSRLAQAAVMLLLLAPVGTRLQSATSFPARATHGPGAIQASSFGHDHDTPSPAHPDHAMQPDCTYCLLLGTLDLATVRTLAATSALITAAFTADATIPSRVWRHPNGLGSRGPPTIFQLHNPT